MKAANLRFEETPVGETWNSSYESATESQQHWKVDNRSKHPAVYPK